MSVPFSAVPASAVASGVFVEQQYKRSGPPGVIPQRVALLGQYNTGKTPTVNQPLNITSADDAASYFGIGSMLHRMAKRLFQAIGAVSIIVDAFPLAAGTGAATGGTVTVTGPATSAGVVALYVAGERLAVSVASGDSANTIATAISAAINAISYLPVTAGVVGAVVTLTPRWVGLSANNITIRQDILSGDASAEPVGVGLTIAALAGGATDPAIDTALANMGNTWYTWVVSPYNSATSCALLEAAGVTRVGPSVKKPFIGVVGYNDTRANFLTWLSSRNSPWTTAVPVDGGPDFVGEIAAAAVGSCVVSAASEPARPFKTLPLPNIKGSPNAAWTYAQKDAVEQAGGSTTYADTSGVMRILDLVTTYKTNALGAADDSWRFAVTISNVQAKIYSLDNLFSSAPFDRAVVVDDAAVTGKEFAVSPKRVKAYIVALIDQQWIPNAWSKNRDSIVAGIVAEINVSNPGRIDVLIPDVIAVGLRIMAVEYQWSFSA